MLQSCCALEATVGVLCLLWWYHAATSILVAHWPERVSLDHLAAWAKVIPQMNGFVDTSSSWKIWGKSCLPSSRNTIWTRPVGHPETSFWVLAFRRNPTAQLMSKSWRTEWIGGQGIATGSWVNRCQHIKHLFICKPQLFQWCLTLAFVWFKVGHHWTYSDLELWQFLVVTYHKFM